MVKVPCLALRANPEPQGQRAVSGQMGRSMLSTDLPVPVLDEEALLTPRVDEAGDQARESKTKTLTSAQDSRGGQLFTNQEEGDATWTSLDRKGRTFDAVPSVQPALVAADFSAIGPETVRQPACASG